MRVAVHPAGDDACGLYRMVEPARVLAYQGADVDCTRTVAWRFSRTDDDRPYRLVDTVDSDVVVFQRPLARRKYDMIRCLQEAGVAVVVELDDDFGNVHPRNAAWADAHPEWMTPAEAAERGVTTSERLTRGDRRWVRTPGVVSWSSNVWLRKACQVADLVTVTTPALAERYAPHGRVAVLPNLVPARYLDVRDAIMAKARTALTVNAAFLAITTPTNAQVVAQVKALTRETTGLIRLLLDELDSTEGT